MTAPHLTEKEMNQIQADLKREQMELPEERVSARVRRMRADAERMALTPVVDA